MITKLINGIFAGNSKLIDDGIFNRDVKIIDRSLLEKIIINPNSFIDLINSELRKIFISRIFSLHFFFSFIFHFDFFLNDL